MRPRAPGWVFVALGATTSACRDEWAEHQRKDRARLETVYLGRHPSEPIPSRCAYREETYRDDEDVLHTDLDSIHGFVEDVDPMPGTEEVLTSSSLGTVMFDANGHVL